VNAFSEYFTKRQTIRATAERIFVKPGGKSMIGINQLRCRRIRASLNLLAR
jgi:hypothetical protein